MAELPNRMDLEADFNRRLSRLSARHRRELRELLGTPPDPRNVPDEFWRRVEDERNAEMLLLLLLITQESQRLHVGELLPDALQDLPEDALASVARDWSGQRAASVAAGNVAKARERLAVRADYWRNFAGGVPSEQLEGDLVDVFGPRMDSATAATETTSAQTAGANGAIGAAEAFGYRVATRWYTRKDDRVCPVCAPLHGKIVDLWELVLRNVVAPGGTRAIESIAANGGPPAHPNCILPGNLVAAPGRIAAATKAFYVGRCVEITTANGCRVSVTENHPILTPSGWVAAKFITKGSNVISTSSADRVASSVNPDDYNGPSPVEEIFGSLVESFGVSSRCVPSSTEQFYGDAAGFNGEIDVVNSERHLWDTLHSGGLTKGLENLFSLCLDAPILANDSIALAFCNALFPSAGRCVSLRNLIGPLLWGHSGPLNPLRLRLTSRSNPVFDQPSPKRSAIDTTLAREFVLAFPGDVASDQVVEIRNFDASSHVYDLQVEPYELYICGGVVVKNCRCYVTTTVEAPARRVRTGAMGENP